VIYSSFRAAFSLFHCPHGQKNQKSREAPTGLVSPEVLKGAVVSFWALPEPCDGLSFCGDLKLICLIEKSSSAKKNEPVPAQIKRKIKSEARELAVGSIKKTKLTAFNSHGLICLSNEGG
jgi:hypothetical protein